MNESKRALQLQKTANRDLSEKTQDMEEQLN